MGKNVNLEKTKQRIDLIIKYGLASREQKNISEEIIKKEFSNIMKYGKDNNLPKDVVEELIKIHRFVSNNPYKTIDDFAKDDATKEIYYKIYIPMNNSIQ